MLTSDRRTCLYLQRGCALQKNKRRRMRTPQPVLYCMQAMQPSNVLISHHLMPQWHTELMPVKHRRASALCSQVQQPQH